MSDARERIPTHGPALEHASEDLRADREIVLAAVAANVRALSHASKQLQEDTVIIKTASCARNQATGESP